MAVAVLAIPPLLRGLGQERFGVLTLAWATVGYFSFVEFGLSRALTQAVAQRLGSGESGDLPIIARGALLLLAVLGTAAAAVLAVLVPWLVREVLNVPPDLRTETIRCFWILAAMLPFVVTSLGLRGLMDAHQHFGASTAVRVPVVAFMFLAPLAVLPFSRSLVPAVALIALGRILGFVAQLWFCLVKYPYLRAGRERQTSARATKVLAPLIRFSAWATVSSIVLPTMTILDRFLIATILPLAALASYATPYEIVVKLLLIPMALLGAIFPAFATTLASDTGRIGVLYERSQRAVLIVTFPIALLTITLAREGLALWVGSALPPVTSIVLQWLALGVFVAGIAQPPLTVLHSAGRPDVVGRLQLAELPLYAVAIVLSMRSFGLPGVAVVWTARQVIETAALLWLARGHLGLSMAPRRGGWWSVTAMLAAIAGGAVMEGATAKAVYVALVLAAFLPIAWTALLGQDERDGLRLRGRGKGRATA